MEKEFVEAFHGLPDCTRSLRLSAKEPARFSSDGSFGGGRTGTIGGQYEETRGSQRRAKRESVDGLMLDPFASAADGLHLEARCRTCRISVERSATYTQDVPSSHHLNRLENSYCHAWLAMLVAVEGDVGNANCSNTVCDKQWGNSPTVAADPVNYWDIML